MTNQLNLSAVSETLLVPLYCRAMETESNQPMIIDEKAVEITRFLDRELVGSDSRLHKALLRRKLPGKLPATMALRTRKFDGYVLDFFKSHEKPVIVTLGCGLDTRFERIDNGTALWYELDFPEVIELRRRFFQETQKRRFIPASVLDFHWIESLSGVKDRPCLFIAEGLLMYLREKDVQELLMQLLKDFPGSELACEVSNAYWVRKMQHPYYQRKFQRQLCFSKDAIFTFGVKDAHEFEKWDNRMKFLDEWTYFDVNEPKLGWFNLFGKIEILKKVQWILHYQLGDQSVP